MTRISPALEALRNNKHGSLSPIGLLHDDVPIAAGVRQKKPTTSSLQQRPRSSRNAKKITGREKSASSLVKLSEELLCANPTVGLPSSKVATVRIEPSSVLIEDYAPNAVLTTTVKIHNFSTETQRVSLQPPRSGRFKLRQRKLDAIPIAPGLDLTLDIEFHAPAPASVNPQLTQRTVIGNPRSKYEGFNAADSSQLGAGNLLNMSISHHHENNVDPTSVKYIDRLIIDVHGQRSILVPLEAFPEYPCLSFSDTVDFGVLLLYQSNKIRAAKKQHLQSVSDLVSPPSGTDQNQLSDLQVSNTHPSKPEIKEDSLKGKIAEGAGTDRPGLAATLPTVEPISQEQEVIRLQAVRILTIRNTGMRRAKARLVYDRSLPVRISPTSINLAPENGLNPQGLPTSCEIRIEITPKEVGRFQTFVRVELQDIVPHNNRTGLIANTLSKDLQLFNHRRKPTVTNFRITAQVVEQRLFLQSLNGRDEMDPSSLNFGSIYYSQSTFLPARLCNSGPRTVRWVITHAGESVPMTPSISRFQSHDDEENKTAISVSPSEGFLEPYSSTPIKFTFSPHLQPSQRGFRSFQDVHPPHTYQVPMQLKVINTLKDSFGQTDEPMNLNLVGQACPLEIVPSKTSFRFPVANLHSLQIQEFEIANNSCHLPIEWSISPVAHFHAAPQQGKLAAGEKSKCTINFKPNCFGQFRVSMDMSVSATEENNKRRCIRQIALKVSGLCSTTGGQNAFGQLEEKAGSADRRKTASSGETQVPLSDALIPSEEYMAIAQKLFDTSRPPASPESQIRYTIMSASNSRKGNPVREAFVAHRRTYDTYISTRRQERLHRDVTRKYGDDAIALFNLDGGHRHLLGVEDLIMTDPENGLDPPEPSTMPLPKRRLKTAGNDISSALDAETALVNFAQMDDRKKRQLFEKLVESSASGKPRAQPSLASSSTVHTGLNDDPLSAEDLASIYTASSSVELGEITVHSSNRRPLNFLNATRGALIHISLLPDAPQDSQELKLSPEQIYIPPMSICGFDITFQSHKPGVFQRKISYLVNGRYKYQIPVTVKVIPVNLALSVGKLDLEATVASRADGSIAPPTASAVVQLINRGNYHANFNWIIPAAQYQNSKEEEPSKAELGAFSVAPMSGMIEPKQTLDITVTYTPGISASYLDVLKTEVIDDTDATGVTSLESHTVTNILSLPCRADIHSAKCALVTSLKQGPLDLGNLPVCEQYSPLNAIPFSSEFNVNYRIIKFKNAGTDPAFFLARSTSSAHSELQLQPQQGIISGNGEIVEVKIWVTPSVIGTVNDTVFIYVFGGGKPLRIPVKYEVRVPDVELQTAQCCIETGTVLGSWNSAPIELLNKGSVLGRIVFDARDHPEFEISLDENQEAVDNNTPGSRKAPIIQVINHGEQGYEWRSPGTNPSGNSSRKAQAVHTHTGNGLQPPAGDQPHDMGKLYLLDLQPLESVKLRLMFRPNAIGVHRFELPIRLTGNSSKSWNLPVQAEGIPSPLTISRKSIVFKNKVVFKEAGPLGVSHLAGALREVVSLTNNSNTTLSYWLDTEDADEDDVFRFDPVRGTLASGEACILTILFQPESVGQFTATVPLHLDLLGTSSFVLEVQGTGVEPSLAFSPPEIFLPIVPLGVESSATFSIVNYGCERAEIRHNIPENSEKLGVELTFPEGKLLKADGEKLTVILKFVGKTPVSFTSRIELRDSIGRAFYLPFHGTTDNSLLTLSGYLYQSRQDSAFVVQKANGPIKYEKLSPISSLDENQKRTRMLSTPRVFKSPGGVPLDNSVDALKFFLHLGVTAKRWMDDHTTTGVELADFPQCFIVSNGKLLHDLINAVAGRKSVPSAVIQSAAPTADERAWLLYKQYNELLDQLIAIGAMLNSVKAEFLLSFEDYSRVTRMKMEKLGLLMGPSQEEFAEYFSKMELYFSCISAEAWATILLQALRVHVVGQITLRQFRSLPGVGKDEASVDMQLSGSNVYSVSECVILKWVTYHAYRRTGKYRRVTNFDADLCDGIMLANLIVSHLPHFAETHLRDMELAPQTAEAQESNAKIIVAALVDLFGAIDVSASSIAKGSSLDIFLLCCFLYQNLPQLIPRATIEFNGKLHERIQRLIEIGNSGYKPITYLVRLDGASEFFAKENSLYLASKATTRFSIEMIGKFSRTVTGQLKMRSKRLSLNNTSILVFNLVSSVEKSPPKRTYHVEACLYHTPGVTVEVEITNPFPMLGRFALHVTQTRPPSNRAAQITAERTAEQLDDDTSEHNQGPPPAFRVPLEEIVLASEGSIIIPVLFIPFEPGAHECILHLVDEKIGEFTYAIDGQATIPETSELLQWTCKAGSTVEKPIRVNPWNSARDKALYASFQGVPRSSGKSRQSKIRGDTTGSQQQQQQQNMSLMALSLPHVPIPEEREVYHLPRRPLRYRVESSSPYFRGPAEITIRPPVEQGKDHKHAVQLDQNYTELPITFLPKLPGKYCCTVILDCMEASDYRVYKIEGISMSEGSKADLEFAVPARQTVSQDIPVVNKTADDWIIKASLQASNFYGPYAITAKAHQTTYYPISFRPTKAGESQGILNLSNLQTAQKHVYYLKGVGREPYPEEEFVYRCRARDRLVIPLTVRNYDEGENAPATEFEVVHPQPYPEGLENTNPLRSLKINAGETADYELRIHVRLSGVYKYNVRFVPRPVESTETVSYVWFAIELDVQPPPAEGKLKLEATVRKLVTLEIPITNPFAEEGIKYKVDFSGKGVFGDSTIQLGPGKKRDYQLIYSPMLQDQSKGRIAFHNPKIGEFWYELDLVASEAAKIELPSMECPLGKYTSQQIIYQNPLDTHITLDINNTNPRDFSLTEESAISSLQSSSLIGDHLHSLQVRAHQKKNIQLGPLESKALQLMFYPSSLTEVQHCRLELISSEIGNALYEVEGRGTVPIDAMETTRIHCRLGGVQTGVVGFENPFIDPVIVGIKLENRNQDYGNCFQLITTHSHSKARRATLVSQSDSLANSSGTQPFIKHAVPELSRLDIPFAFSPEAMTTYNAHVIVEVLDKAAPDSLPLRWTYPIRGIVECSAVVVLDGQAAKERKLSNLQNAAGSAYAAPRVDFESRLGEADELPGHRPTEMADPTTIQQSGPTDPYSANRLLWASSSPTSPPTPQPKVFATRAREALREEFEVILPGYIQDKDFLADADRDFSDGLHFDFDLAPKLEPLLSKSFSIEMMRATWSDQGMLVRFKIIYSPTRPATLHFQLRIMRNLSEGELWTFPVQLSAAPPAIDNVIILEGLLNKVTSVSFEIQNPAEEDRPFKAYFTPETPPHFSVYPEQGNLIRQKSATQGDNTFVVGCRFMDYGKTLVGTLVVEAEDMSWSFEVRGVLPRYQSPSGERRRSILPTGTLTPLATRHNGQAFGGTKKRNFVRANSDVSRFI